MKKPNVTSAAKQAEAVLILDDLSDALDDLLREAREDYERRSAQRRVLSLAVGWASASGLDDAEYADVDIETGKLILEAAIKIVAARRRDLGLEAAE